MGLAVLLAGMSAVAVVPARAEDPVCFECHDDFPNKMKAFKFTHDPAAGGECTACHLDHKDEEKLMLVKEGAALCYECHDNMAHGDVGPPAGGGGQVHRLPQPPRFGEQEAPRRRRAARSARSATPRARSSRGRSPTPRSTTAAATAIARTPRKTRACSRKTSCMDRLALFDPKQAELCLGCHDLETFTKAQTEDTGFRMGTTNLHALHLNGGAVPNKYGIVKKKDGQTCFACHLPHTAHQEKLLRTEYQCTGHLLLHDALCPRTPTGGPASSAATSRRRTRGRPGPERDRRSREKRSSASGPAAPPPRSRAARRAGSLTNLDAPSDWNRS